MRIAVVNHHAGVVGGVETYLQDLLPALAARGHRLALVHEIPASHETIALDTQGVLEERLSLADLGVGRVCEALARWTPDVVYANSSLDVPLGSALLDRFPCALYWHSYQGSCVSGTKMFDFPRATPCDRQLGPACLALFYPRRCGGLNPLVTAALYSTQQRTRDQLGQYAAVLVASEHMSRECTRHGVQPTRITVTAPCVSVAPDTGAPVSRRREGRLLFAGRLTHLKGVDLFIDALPLVQSRLDSPIHATIVGEGPDRPALTRAAMHSDVDVRLVGQRTRDEVRTLMRAADLLVVPSRWPEPFGLVGVEAAAVGLPAVGFAVGGIPEWLESGVTGELAAADPPTAGKLADAIVAALGDRAHHQRLREGAWHMAVEVAGRDHVTILESVLARCAGHLSRSTGDVSDDLS